MPSGLTILAFSVSQFLQHRLRCPPQLRISLQAHAIEIAHFLLLAINRFLPTWNSLERCLRESIALPAYLGAKVSVFVEYDFAFVLLLKLIGVGKECSGIGIV